jgi:hypothetical protein
LTIAVIAGHLLLDILFGYCLLSFIRGERTATETLAVAPLIGMYVETLFAATLLFLRVPLTGATIGVATLMVLSIGAALYRGMVPGVKSATPRLKWYEWLLLGSILEKLVFAAWQLAATRTYFDDALTHWSGRARSLFGQINWSFDPSSPFFLGKHIGASNYPLLTIVWRTLSAKANGEWNDTISRADGLLFFIVIVATVWLAAWRLSRIRWLAATAAFAASAMPLHRWHEASGYSDMAVEAFVVAAVAALIRRDWLLAGILTAGATWSKNDGLLIFLPALIAAAGLMNPRKLPIFTAGVLTIAPWLIFNAVHHLGFTPGKSEIAWHSDAVVLLLNALANNPSSSILWMSIFACLIYSGVAMLKDTTGRALFVAFLMSFGSIAFIFSWTNAYSFLNDQTTIHRTLLQLSGMGIVVAMYGLYMKVRHSLKADAAASA